MSSSASSVARRNGQHAIKLDALVVGAGFGGIYALYKLRGLSLNVKAFEKGSGVGGTWFWNRYPGCRCDVPSMEYSYSFSEELQQQWEWTEVHATQPEIERYCNHVVDRFDLRKDIQLNSEVTSAQYDETAKLWCAKTADGQTVLATYLMLTTGGYHRPIVPNIPGIDSFKGELYFSNDYPATEPSYAGKRIGVIRTGSTGHQTTVALGEQPIKHLYVFQRTPGYIAPSYDRPLTAEEVVEHKAHYAERRERARHTGYGVDITSFPVGGGKTIELTDDEFDRRAELMWQSGGGTVQTMFPDFATDARANKRIAEFLNKKLREQIMDPQLGDSLCRQDYYLGAKRIIIIDHYVSTLQKPNVSLVDTKRCPIQEITPRGVRTPDREYELDMLILATGFDSATGSILKIDIRGRKGLTLERKWADGPSTYLGLGVHGFPNMFSICQVGSPGIRSHMMVQIEQHVDWIADLIVYAKKHGVEAIEASQRAEDTWTAHVAEVAGTTILTVDDSQHLGSNVPGKPRVVTSYLGGVGAYRRICDAVAANDYEGWSLHTSAGLLANSPDWSGPKRKVRWETRDDEVREEGQKEAQYEPAGFL